MAIMSAWGRGSFPADCEQSAKTRPPCFRTTALNASKDWITPVSLFTCCIATNESATSKGRRRSEEHTSELQSLMRISYAVFCLKKKIKTIKNKLKYNCHTA